MMDGAWNAMGKTNGTGNAARAVSAVNGVERMEGAESVEGMKGAKGGTGKVFCLPFNGDVEFALDYARRNKGRIHEFYGSDGRFSTGRLTKALSKADFERLVRELDRMDIRFDYLMNASSVEECVNRADELLEHAAYLRSVGVSTVTLSHPHFAQNLKNLGLEVSTSLVQNLKTIQDALWAQAFGYDRLKCSDDLNRDVRQLRVLLNGSPVPVEVLANNMCLPSCPLRASHYSFDELLAQNPTPEMWEKKKTVVLCRGLWAEHPDLFLKSGWLRPQDVERVLDMGAAYVKLAGRSFPSAKLQQVMDAYLGGSWQGGVFGFLRPGEDPNEKYGLPDILAADMDDYFDFVFDGGCAADCSACDFCARYAERLGLC